MFEHVLIELSLCNILAECSRLSANQISDENLNTINIFVVMSFSIKCYTSPKKSLEEHCMLK